MNQAKKITITGRVQGVGFRPFVYRIAHESQLHGWVKNTVGRVEIYAVGTDENIEAFQHDLIAKAPPLSQPEIEFTDDAEIENTTGFYILRSDAEGEAEIHCPPDQFLCPECEAELNDIDNRRYRYPFINCTQCGPRYTIIRAMPYDRSSTSMESFHLCEPCHQEYISPENRRFHAEPNACNECGPRLSYYDPEQEVQDDNDAALAAAVQALKSGRILAVKGIGGYHLMCDAANEVAVVRLRKNKHRPHKPLALMVPAKGADQLEAVRQLVEIDNDVVAAELRSPSRPIILLKRKVGAPVCNEVAPDMGELGVMLPASPMHVLLMQDFGQPLVATSGNISGEPVLTDDMEADARLKGIAEGWLIHNRDIVRPADDAVERTIADEPRMIRLGRGVAPGERALPMKLKKPVIAVGGHMKNTVALAWDNRVVISPHIGELSEHRSMQVFEQVIHDLQTLYQVKAETLICDQHPHYASNRWAHEQGLPVYEIQHHRAHASALAADDIQASESAHERGLIFTWDGVGYGDDGLLWGGETFLGQPGDWQRVASFRPFRLMGGDMVSHQPWRSAAALHWTLDENYPGGDQEKLAHIAWQSGLNSFDTSAVGRLFDAVAAMLGLAHETSHEGEAPMRLEAIAEDIDTMDSLPFHEQDGVCRIDWEPLFYAMKNTSQSIGFRAGYAHALFANTIVDAAEHFKCEQSFDYVGLTGGVFQNRRLTERVIKRMKDCGIPVRLARTIPMNDGGLSFGQIIEYAAKESSVVH